jgi:hypothetical protein
MPERPVSPPWPETLDDQDFEADRLIAQSFAREDTLSHGEPSVSAAYIVAAGTSSPENSPIQPPEQIIRDGQDHSNAILLREAGTGSGGILAQTNIAGDDGTYREEPEASLRTPSAVSLLEEMKFLGDGEKEKLAAARLRARNKKGTAKVLPVEKKKPQY